MSNKNAIQINIPTPCNEDWEKMTPCGQGRFCGVCQKTVIDFTTWSDAALFEFFTKNTAPVCGSFLGRQLSRQIQMPPQPVSRLYRIAIACGLTLMFTQIPEAHANVKAPIEYAEPQQDEKDATGSIEGTVLDEKGEPAIGAVITLLKNGIKQAGAVSDIDGNYLIKPLAAGVYDLSVEYSNYKKITITKITIAPNEVAKVNGHLNQNYLEEVSIIYQKPLIPTTSERVITIEDLRHQGGPMTSPYLVTSINSGMQSFRGRGETIITMRDGTLINEKKKKGFFSFLKRKKKKP